MNIDDSITHVRKRQINNVASTYEVTLADEVERLRRAKSVVAVEVGRLHARIAELETALTDPTKWCGKELLEERAKRDRIRAAFDALRAAYYHEDNVACEVRCELIDDLDEALRS